MISLKTQVAIFGGGVAGLWLLKRLQQLGVNSVLIENNELGGGQTIFSQGIIHSGLKYALTGKLTASTKAMLEVPKIWQACLKGEGEIDLSSVKTLSACQYLWSPGSLAATMMTFFASKSLRGRVERVSPVNYPSAFSASDFKGVVYALHEPVLSVRTLIEALTKNHFSSMIKAHVKRCEYTPSGDVDSVQLETATGLVHLNAKHFILLAGKGNELLARQFGLTLPRMQLRPLAMVTLAMPSLPSLFAHAMQAKNKPRMTITTHRNDEKTVWYLGGDLAETGVKRTKEEQVNFARRELTELFPHLDLSQAEFQVNFIERAEARQSNHLKPDHPVFIHEKNVITAWPTKLAFAPQLAQQILDSIMPGLVREPDVYSDLSLYEKLEKPAIADYPWNKV